MPFITFAILCAEVVILIKFGQAVGGGLVLLEILLSGGLGFLLLRAAGRSVLEPGRVIELLMRPPTRSLVQSLGFLFLGGLLLLLPGLLSDATGLVLTIWAFLQRGGGPRERPDEPDTIDVEFTVHDDVSHT